MSPSACTAIHTHAAKIDPILRQEPQLLLPKSTTTPIAARNAAYCYHHFGCSYSDCCHDYGYPLAWLTRMVLAPEYYPWRMDTANFVVDIIIWTLAIGALLLILTRIEK